MHLRFQADVVLRGALHCALAILALSAALVLSYGQSGDSGASPTQEGRDLVIGPEDSLNIVLLGSDEISKVWRVGATGELNLPMVGSIHAAGMTVGEFESELTRRLRRYYKDPQLTVFISEFRSQPVTITGAVIKPGTTQLEGNRTLFDVIMRAGGPKDAGPNITLTRAEAHGPIPWPGTKEDGNGYYVATFETKDVVNGRSGAANVVVEPYDIVSVQEGKMQNLVHIIGEVYKPGSVELTTRDSVSLLKVIALAGGLTKGAAANKARIIHIGPNGSRGEPAIVNLKTIMNGKALDLELTAGDVVIVPPQNGLKANAQAVALTAANAGVWILATL